MCTRQEAASNLAARFSNIPGKTSAPVRTELFDSDTYAEHVMRYPNKEL
jgi:hypothetical protein